MWTALIELVKGVLVWVALLFAKRSGKQEGSLERDTVVKEKVLKDNRNANKEMDVIRNLPDDILNDELRLKD